MGFDHAATLFHIRDSPADPVERPIYLTNTFSFAILIHDVCCYQKKPKQCLKYVSWPLILWILPVYQANGTDMLFSLPSSLGSQLQQTSLNSSQRIRLHFYFIFYAVPSSMHIDNNILLITNASKFPYLCGYIQVFRRKYVIYLTPLKNLNSLHIFVFFSYY